MDHLSALQPLGNVARSDHCRDAVFPGNNGTVTQDATDVCDESRCMGEELRPGRRGRLPPLFSYRDNKAILARRVAE